MPKAKETRSCTTVYIPKQAVFVNEADFYHHKAFFDEAFERPEDFILKRLWLFEIFFYQMFYHYEGLFYQVPDC